MKLEENIIRIKEMMGLIKEDTPSKWKPCKKCVKKYNGLMGDDCAYEAIERFEENYGTAQGTSMGDNYFEGSGNWKTYDQRIVGRITDIVPNAWNSMSSNFKMQLWSFMYNSDSSSSDQYRWLALLYLTANNSINDFNYSIAKKIINNKNSQEWIKAVKEVNNFKNWSSSYSKFLKMIDGQYSTYSNKGAYEKSWGKRPTALDEMYNECKTKTSPKQEEKPKEKNYEINARLKPELASTTYVKTNYPKIDLPKSKL